MIYNGDIRQETFERVVKFLVKQGKRSVAGNSYLCAYRGEDNTKCAIGCLIPDEEYRPEMEGELVDQLMNSDMVPSLSAFKDSKGIEFLAELQELHDMWRGGNVNDLIHRAVYLANMMNLDFNFLHEMLEH